MNNVSATKGDRVNDLFTVQRMEELTIQDCIITVSTWMGDCSGVVSQPLMSTRFDKPAGLKKLLIRDFGNLSVQ